jgi:mono/diheme cytochrome c family protein
MAQVVKPSALPDLRPILSILGGLAIALGCNRSPDSLPEWTPADHDNKSKPAPGQVDTKAARPGMPDLQKEGITDLTLATWKQNCATCHGMIGRGDGPQAATFKPPDFTSAAWQRTAMEQEMERAILKGRGRMPAFGHLPPETVKSLVRLVRRMGPSEGNAEQGQADTPPAHGTASP